MESVEGQGCMAPDFICLQIDHADLNKNFATVTVNPR